MGPYLASVFSVVPLFEPLARAPRMATEAVFALCVRVLVAVILTCLPPWLQEKWEHFGWRNAVLFGLSFLFIPLLFYGLYCWGDVPIPQYSAECDFGGLILDALYPGFLAFLFNYVGEDLYSRAAKAVNRKRSFRFAYAWYNNLWVWAFIGTVAVEFVLLNTALSPWTSLAISVIASIAMTVFVVLFQELQVYRDGGYGRTDVGLGWRLGALTSLVSAALREILWWVVIAVKIIVHLLPIPFWLKPIFSIVLTIALFIFVNVILTTPRRQKE